MQMYKTTLEICLHVLLNVLVDWLVSVMILLEKHFIFIFFNCSYLLSFLGTRNTLMLWTPSTSETHGRLSETNSSSTLNATSAEFRIYSSALD